MSGLKNAVVETYGRSEVTL